MKIYHFAPEFGSFEEIEQTAMNDVLVSVICATFNHSKYISRCIESILRQNCPFSIEIIVLDNCSTDGTQDILRNLSVSYPNRLKLILEDKNRFLERSPIVAAFQHASGKYIALCDGDDYWTSDQKLSKTVSLLEQRSDLVLVGHRTAFIHDNLGSVELKAEGMPIYGVAGESARGSIPLAHTSSLVFQRRVLDRVASDPIRHHPGDFKIKIYACDLGKTLVLPDIMSVYTIHAKGFWSSRNRLRQSLDAVHLLSTLEGLSKATERSVSRALGSASRAVFSNSLREGEILRGLIRLAKFLIRPRHWKISILLGLINP